jgi:hypothetical protein
VSRFFFVNSIFQENITLGRRSHLDISPVENCLKLTHDIDMSLEVARAKCRDDRDSGKEGANAYQGYSHSTKSYRH